MMLKSYYLSDKNQLKLYKLASFLRNDVPEELFNMESWLTLDRANKPHKRANFNCGTAACAAGWATAIFKELTYDYKNERLLLNNKFPIPKGYCTIGSYLVLQKFFGIKDYDDVYHLFGPHTRSLKDEASIIETFILKHKKKINIEEKTHKHG